MKANEWLKKFKENAEEASFEFGEETVKLVEERSKKSKKEYRGAAIDGAMREQRQKWKAICSRMPNLREEAFLEIVERSNLKLAAEHQEFLNLKAGKQGRGRVAAKSNAAQPVPGESEAASALSVTSYEGGVSCGKNILE